MSHRLVVPKEAEQAKQLGNVLFAKEKFNAAIEVKRAQTFSDCTDSPVDSHRKGYALATI
jgi:hypothetical protein